MASKSADHPDIVMNLVLDKSSSMNSVCEATISAVNEYVDGVRNDAERDNKTVLLSLTLFDTRTHIVHAITKIADVSPLTKETYVPSGMTALLDAIGNTVTATASKIDEAKWRPAVLCVIMTDGQENCSTSFNSKDIADLIKGKEQEGNWTFVYLGADKEAWNVGESLGIGRKHSVKYDTKNIVKTMSALRCATSNYVKSMNADESNEVLSSDNFFAGAADDLEQEAVQDAPRGIDLNQLPKG